jgi:flagellar basal-body rod protein FlgB
MALGGIFDLLKDKMAYLTQRQGVIADNIANAYTPNFKAKDLVSFEEVLQKAGGGPGSSGIQLAATNAMHFGGANSGSSAFKAHNDPEPYEVKPNGNNVILEQQMTQLAQTSSDYAMVTSLYHKSVGMIKMALSRGTA